MESHLEMVLIEEGGLSETERRLLQVIVLHRLEVAAQREHQRTQDKLMRFLKTIAGVMGQHNLTLLMLELETSQIEQIFRLGNRVRGLDRHVWERAMVGASACARVAKALCQIEDVSVFLPSAHEDVNLGIDLFAIRSDGFRLGVSVKTGAAYTDMKASMIWTKPRRASDQNTEELRVFQGVEKASKEYGETFAAIVHAGRPNGRALYLEEDDGDALEIAELFVDVNYHLYGDASPPNPANNDVHGSDHPNHVASA